ncbi:ferredoxin [Patescibacteria group bacterium]
MAYKVEVIREACISAGSCAVLAEKTFELDEEGLAIIEKQNGDSDEDILAAAQSCPTNAIIVKDENGEQVWPEV